MAIIAVAVSALLLCSQSLQAQQASQCGFTSSNDYVCPGQVGSFSGNIQPLPTFEAPTGSSLPTYNTGNSNIGSATDYQAALRKLESQLAKDQQALEDFMADPEAYDDGTGHTWSGDITPIELTAALCPYGETRRLPNGKLPVFPGAKGFGVDTPAGRGGKIIKVTNLNNSGSGSLRACVEASGPRVCVFEVSGNIKLTSQLTIKNPYITIAGQTAPSPGITLTGATFEISTHDVLVQHIRHRLGSESSYEDGIRINAAQRDAYNVVIDHASVSWGIDESMSTYSDVKDITVSNSIIAEALDMVSAYGFLVMDRAQNVAMVGNLFAHNEQRNPLLKGGTSTVMLNNLLYNGDVQFTHIGDSYDSGPTMLSLVSNVAKEGPNSSSKIAGLNVRSNATEGTKVYMEDNKYIGDSSYQYYKNEADFDPLVSHAPIWDDSLSALSSDQTEEYVLSNAGARPADRDPVDNRIINDVINGTGGKIDTEKEVGGLPNLAKNFRAFNAPANPNGDDDGDGYTNLEEVLHQYAAEVEGCL